MQLLGARGGTRMLLTDSAREPQLQGLIARAPLPKRMPRGVLLQPGAQLGETLTLAVQAATGASGQALREVIQALQLLLQAQAGMRQAQAAVHRLEARPAREQ